MSLFRLATVLWLSAFLCAAGAAVIIVPDLWLFSAASGSPAAPGAVQPAPDPAAGPPTPAPLTTAALAAAALLTATAGWLVTNAINLQAQHRSRASDYIREALANEKLVAALNAVGEFGRIHATALSTGDAAAITALSADFRASAVLRGDLRRTLNFFEEMAIFIRRQAADERVLRDWYVGTLYRLHAIYRPLKPLIRGAGPAGRVAPEMYENLDWLFDRWGRFYRDNYLFH